MPRIYVTTERFMNLHCSFFTVGVVQKNEKKGKNDFGFCSLVLFFSVEQTYKCLWTMLQKGMHDNNQVQAKWNVGTLVKAQCTQKENSNFYNLLSKQQYCRPICLLWQFWVGKLTWSHYNCLYKNYNTKQQTVRVVCLLTYFGIFCCFFLSRSHYVWY